MKTINKVFLILFVSLAASSLFAQSAVIDTFVKKVNLTGKLTATVQAADGGYVTISRLNNTSFLVIKIKGSGQKQWERRLNFLDPNNNLASINGVAQTTDGGFVLAGQVGCVYLPFECGQGGTILVKLRPNGTIAWQKGFGLSGSNIYFFRSVTPMPDGGVIAIGGILDYYGDSTQNQLLIVRFTATGDVLWKNSFTTLPAARTLHSQLPLISSTPTPDNGFIVAFPTSTTTDAPPNGADVIRINDLGNVVWKKSLNTSGFVFQSVGVTSDGGVILIGTGPNSKKLKVFVLKADGTPNWRAGYTLKGPGVIQSVSSPVQTLDGGYVVTGGSRSGARFSSFIAKIDSSRKISFQNTIGDRNTNGPEAGVSVFATADGGFVVFGLGGFRLLKDIFILKVNSEGIVPGCGLLQTFQFGSTTRTIFGPLRIAGVTTTASVNLPLEALNFGFSSVVTNHRVSTLCQ